MKPDKISFAVLGMTQSKAKMFEFTIPEQAHIQPTRDLASLMPLCIGLLGDFAANPNAVDDDNEAVKEAKRHIRFAARYFDAFHDARQLSHYDPYLRLLASATYYLCDLPGSADVMASSVAPTSRDVGGDGLDWLAFELLCTRPAKLTPKAGMFASDAIDLLALLSSFGDGTNTKDDVIALATKLRERAYSDGSPRHLLLGDVVLALIRRKIRNSSRLRIPEFSKIEPDLWSVILNKESFPKELWPAQLRLGTHGVFSGESAIVQMPTSAGKSRATEIIIRSAFLSGRTTLAVVVAPFRALCHEIRDGLEHAFAGENVLVNEVSDVFQLDIDLDEILSQKTVLVVTPEKLVHLTRHEPELANNIGLIVYDEGHQFDTGTRGVTYELLLTALNRDLPKTTQKVLISAVISNAEDISTWLIGKVHVVTGEGLLPSERSIAFASWKEKLGWLRFVEEDDPDTERFYVPRVIEQHSLQLIKKNEKERSFPTKGDVRTVSLYMGLKVVPRGGVAIFCGTKATAAALCDDVIDAFNRQLPMQKPVDYSNKDEIVRLADLFDQNLGPDERLSKAARMGILSHHGNIPHGLRVAVEHSLKTGLGRFVICTSTLAQGVNLPIKYLIMSSVYQGADKIRVRDFHNLIGRAGRSGMYTEGSVVFADSAVIDGAKSYREKWRWQSVKKMLQASNSEPCGSSILRLFAPLKNKNGDDDILLNVVELVKEYVKQSDDTKGLSDKLAKAFEADDNPYSALFGQLLSRIAILESIEGFLLNTLNWSSAESFDEQAKAVAQDTLAYFLGSDHEKKDLVTIFGMLAQGIRDRVSSQSVGQTYSRMMRGVLDARAIEKWYLENRKALQEAPDDAALVSILWPLIDSQIRNKVFRDVLGRNALVAFCQGWISGKSYTKLHGELVSSGARIKWGKGSRSLTVEHVVELGEDALGFDAALILGSICELIALHDESQDELSETLKRLQKRFKHGLATASTVVVYEAGFSDRCVAPIVAGIVGNVKGRAELRMRLKELQAEVHAALQPFPSYFTHVFERMRE